MGLHSNTVFKNSCLKVPINPLNKLPTASYERKHKSNAKSSPNLSIENFKTDNTEISLKEFYNSIPDYKDVTHLSNKEFYNKLQKLKDHKNKLLLNIDRNISSAGSLTQSNTNLDKDVYIKQKNPRHESSLEKFIDTKHVFESDLDSLQSAENNGEKVNVYNDLPLNSDKMKYSANIKRDSIPSLNKSIAKTISPSSVSWNNDIQTPTKFHNDFRSKDRFSINSNSPVTNSSIYKKSRSLPSSPIKKSYSPLLYDTKLRNMDGKIMSNINHYSKDLEYKFLEKDKRKKYFKANPVPIESRIPLYEKILEDQELRRAIAKLQSTAELQAQMKPFSFTEREEKNKSFNRIGCSRLSRSNPQLNFYSSSDQDLAENKKFKAKPIPKNLFSNYIYEKMKEDDFYRALNRRIRAEELLKTASLPPSMAKREKIEKNCHSSSCQKYHNYPEVSYNHKKGKIKKKRSRKKSYKNEIMPNGDMNDLNNEICFDKNPDMHNKNHREDLKKIYGSVSSDTVTPSSGYATYPQSGDLSTINKSNLAAVLRIESSKKKLEAEIVKQLEEERYQSEMKWRDSVLRRKPAWKSLNYCHADDLAMRLQMRRDEERLRREQFLHEMELMYGRVNMQPMMFERDYSPRKYVQLKLSDNIQKKPRSALSKSMLTSNVTSPNRSRKVSINEMAETIDDFGDFGDEDIISKSSDEIPEDILEDKITK